MADWGAGFGTGFEDVAGLKYAYQEGKGILDG